MDSGGTCIGLVAPPPTTEEHIEEITKAMEKLRNVGKIDEHSHRGRFKIVEAGLQMGQGIQVRTNTYVQANW
jgi:hypothetical protein